MTIPPGFCQCGCGNKTALATRTDVRRGHVKGQPLRFLPHHYAAPEGAPLEEQFWSFVNKDGPIIVPELGPCWVWTGTTDDKGYGILHYKGQNIKAHQLSYRLNVGPIPEGQYVRHKCDYKPCCNFNHLLPGTHLENMADLRERHRANPYLGEEHPNAKLTDDQVRQIRWLHAKPFNWPEAKIAAKFDIAQTLVSAICRGTAWKHVK